MDRVTELEVFIKIAEEANLTRASEALGMSVSGVSRCLAGLETRLGVRLVQRTTRQLYLTPEGEGFAVNARNILTSLREAEENVSRVTAEPRGLLRVGASLSFALLHLVPVIEAFRRNYPLVRIELEASNRYYDLFENGLDLAIRTRRVEADSSVMIRKLAEVPRVLVASPDYLAQRGTPQDPADLTEHDLLLYNLADDWEHLSLSKGEERVRLPVTGAMVANDGQLLRQAALGGMGILVQPAYIVAEDLQAGRLVQVLGDWALPRLTMNLAFPSREYLPARTRLFIDSLVQHFRDQNFERHWSDIGAGQIGAAPADH